MLKHIFNIDAFAEGSAGGGRAGGTMVRPASQRRRGAEGMGAYYRRTGLTALGGNSRTRGTLRAIRPVGARGASRQ